ncbi:peroxisomal N(1)-acetyl-spermine/spermidine oxidase [Rhinatrema bivittatum]|uniref:peroxisomal N(1)-acetyl-spermine/spermidine oxidase n=1 Tax=Rhinatrema bivittatum TaxID=194408 RepID=UPI00112A8C46|nr:peroxisomal N(1)-acetyl-spermine/spermidine oxidase [Rhinatrema bivittatum]
MAQAPGTSSGSGSGPVVIIVGCGIAGIGAAQRLYRQGYRNIRILEATGRCGGRIRTARFGKGLVEIGAQWIHGPSRANPVFQLASEYGLLDERAMSEENQQVEVAGHPSATLISYSSLGKIVDPELVESINNLYTTILDQTREFLHTNHDPVASVGAYIKKEIARHAQEWTDDEPSKKLKLALLNTLLKLECCISGTHSMDLVGLGPFGEYKMLPGLDCMFPSGYESLTECMLKSLPKDIVLLNKPVKIVHWNDTFGGKKPHEQTFPIKVECESGETFTADHVIITVPLGYLKEHCETFLRPPLPSNKIQAIRKMGFGTNNKIILEFEKPFWKPDCHLIQLIWEDESPLVSVRSDLRKDWCRKLIGFIVLEPPEHYGHVLCGFIAGHESEFMETLTDAEVVTSVTEVLRSFTGNPQLPPPINILRTNWHTSAYTKGSYSYVAVGCSGQDIDTIAQPLPEGQTASKPLQVLFAGEAMHRNFYSTTHGALLSGWREADRLICLYDAQRCKANL